MNAGRRQDLIQFEKKILTANAGGQFVTTWSTTEAQGSFEEWAEAIRHSETSARFTIPFRDGITPASHRILWDGAIWTITNAVHDAKRVDLAIDSDFSALIPATTLASTNKEYVDGLPVLRPLSD